MQFSQEQLRIICCSPEETNARRWKEELLRCVFLLFFMDRWRFCWSPSCVCVCGCLQDDRQTGGCCWETGGPGGMSESWSQRQPSSKCVWRILRIFTGKQQSSSDGGGATVILEEPGGPRKLWETPSRSAATLKAPKK